MARLVPLTAGNRRKKKPRKLAGLFLALFFGKLLGKVESPS